MFRFPPTYSSRIAADRVQKGFVGSRDVENSMQYLPASHYAAAYSTSTNLLGLIESEGKTALSASVSVVVDSHEAGGTALWSSALASQTGDLVVLIDLTNARKDDSVSKRQTTVQMRGQH